MTLVRRIAPFVILAAACTAPSPDAATPGSVNGPPVEVRETRGDIQVVRTESGSIWGQRMVLEPELTIGVLDGAEEYVFGRISSIAVGPDGLLYVLDRQVPVIRVYDGAGLHVRDIGRGGGGPGELRFPSQIYLTPEGSVAVVQGEGNPLIFLSPTGDELERRQWAPRGQSEEPLFIDRSGTINRVTFLPREVAPPPPGFAADPRRLLVRYHPTGAVDSVPLPPSSSRPRTAFTSTRPGASAGLPFVGIRHAAVMRDGTVIVSEEDEVALELTAPDGSVTRVERAEPPVPVGAEEREAWREEIRGFMRGSEPNWDFGAADVPEVKAPVRNVLLGTDDRIWVERAVAATWVDPADSGGRLTEGRWFEPPTWDVFEPDGRFVGQVEVPVELFWELVPGQYTFSEESVWAVVIDSLDVQRVVRFRIVPDSESDPRESDHGD